MILRPLLATAVFILAAAGSALAADKMILNTEEYPPYQHLNPKTKQVEGENVAIVQELFKRAGIPIEIKLDKWEASYAAARKKDNNGVFTAIRNQEREALFQWVGPISVTRWVLLAKKSKGIKIKAVEEAFKYKIGGYKGDAKSEYLEKLGASVDKIDDDAKNAKRLEAGEIDLWATGYVSGMKAAKDAGVTDLEEVIQYREDQGYVALNLDTKAATVLNLNRIVEQMKDQGKIKAKFKD